MSVVVVDNGPPGGGMTARTTAHLSFALDDRWTDLIDLMGLERARRAADSPAAAVALLEEIQAREGISCDFARLDGYLFLAPGDDPRVLDREIKAAHKLGLSQGECH